MKIKSTYSIWILAVTCTLISTYFVFSVNVNDDAIDLLPQKAVQKEIELLQHLGLVNRVIITLHLDSGDTDPANNVLLKKSTQKVGYLLTSSPFFSQTIYKLDKNATLESFTVIQDNLPSLLTDTDLHNLKDKLNEKEIRTSLQKSFSLLMTPAGIGLKQQIQKDPLGITQFFTEKLRYLKIDYNLRVDDGFFLSNDGQNSLIICESSKKLTDGDTARLIDSHLKDIFSQTLPPQVKASVIGTLPHTISNTETVQNDLRTLLPIASLLLLTLLLCILRTPRVLLIFAIPFGAAPLAILITATLFQQISGLALGFGIVLIGIAVDFAIHLYLGLASNQNRTDFLTEIKRPILLATLTTTSVFFIILFSDVPSHRQMATLALTGILLAVIYSWFIIPTIVPTTVAKSPLPIGFFTHVLSKNTKYFCLLLWVVLLIMGGYSWQKISYDGNLQTLDTPNDNTRYNEERFKEIWGGSGDQAFLVASGKSLEQALQANYKAYKRISRITSNNMQTLAPLLPSMLDQKFNQEQWLNFWQENMASFMPIFTNEAEKLGFTPEAFEPFFRWISSVPSGYIDLATYPESLTPVISSMIREVSTADNEQGNFEKSVLVTTTLSVDSTLYEELLQIEKEDDLHLLANRKWKKQVEHHLRHDIILLSTCAALLILLITLITFKNLRLATGVLAPVLSALSSMIVFSWLTGKPLNMMHLLMGIMVIGLAVDYGIFAACSYGKNISSMAQLAISICAMSSLIGFGVLSFADHPALSSLGITVLVGIGTAWPTALIITPFIHEISIQRELKR